MKTALLALALAGFCPLASAQSIYLNLSCGSGFGFSYAGNGFSFSYGTVYPQVVSCARSWGGGYYCPLAVPASYYCPPPLYVNPRAYPIRSAGYTYRPARAVVPDPVFPVRFLQP